MPVEAPVRRSRSPLAVSARAVRRRWRRLRRRLRGHNVQFVYHQAYERTLAAVPLDPERGKRVLAFLEAEGLVSGSDVRLPWPPQIRALLRVHDAEYLESLQRPDEVTRVFGTPLTEAELGGVVDMQRMMVGGTIFATKMAVRDGGVVVNLGGGFHHAGRDFGMGFCLFNDVAVAVARLRSRGFSAPVLVVDLDLHDGNGTRAIFANDPTVYTYSIHAEHWGDTEVVASTSIELGNDVEDEQLLGTLLKTLPDVVEFVSPGLVVYVAGTDPAVEDPMGSWRLTASGMLSRDRFVMDQVHGHGRSVPVVVVLGGGYGDHAWRHTARFASWIMTGRAIEPPANEELVLERYRRIGRELDSGALTADPDLFDWRLTEQDLSGILPEAPHETRFLDYFSQHGIELVLERFGILDQLRILGYKHPLVELDLDHPLGHNLRIFGSADRRELLVELRVNRDTRKVPGCEVLVLEWLLLQNPRAQFGPYRRPLPGQNHPGLGLLKEVLGWLVVVCELIGLDGIYYSPSSYHVAAQSRHLVRFLHPEHEARYRALKETVCGLDLAAASRAVSDGRVIDAETDAPVEWQGFPMVLPVSEELDELVFGEAYEEAVGAELDRVQFRLADGEPASPAEQKKA